MHMEQGYGHHGGNAANLTSMQCGYTYKPEGFALIATTSMMVLLVMIALAMLSLSTVELRSSKDGRAMAEAQANARMALMLALGELQKEMGPDQRISARAAVLDADTESPDPYGVSHPNWMGVWNSWNDWLNNPTITSTYEKGRQTRFRRWLVSHPDAAATQNMDLAMTGTSGGEMVEMLTLPDDPSGMGRVEVPTVATPNGRYAWWITGENQKALIADSSDVDDDFKRLHHRSHWSRSYLGWLEGMEKAPDSEETYRKSVTRNTYGLGAGDPALSNEVKNRYHDLTTDSLGVLSNVRHGGLKKDLNLLLENPVLPDEFGTFRSSNPLGSIVSIRENDGYLPTPVYPQNNNFTSWYKLHQYYQLYRGGGDETAADSFPVDIFPGQFQSAGLWGSDQEPKINFNWQQQNLDCYGIGRTAIVTRLMMIFSTRRVKSADGENYDYKLGINPVVVVWNPYNVNLHSPRLWIKTLPGALQIKTYLNGSVQHDWRPLGELVMDMFAMEGPHLTTTPIILKPGETRIYSAVSGFVSALDFRVVELYPGYQAPDAGGGFEKSLPGLSQLPGSSRVELAMRLNDQRVDHAGQYQMYWTVNNPVQPLTQCYHQLAANPVMDGGPIYLADDSDGKRVLFSNSTEAIPFANCQFVMKSGEDLRNPGEEYKDDDFRCRNFIHANPTNQRTMYGEATKRMRGMSQYHVQIDTGTGNAVSPDFNWANNRAYTGSAISLGGSLWPGQSRVVTNEFPTVPVTSIASLMHFKLNPGDTRNWFTWRHLWEVSANQALAIGNSFAHPLIGGGEIYQDVPDASCRGLHVQMKLIRDFHDHAFLNNDALWDDWYFSGITREDEGLWQSGRTMSKVVTDFESGTGKLANPHLIPWKEPLTTGETLESLLVNGSVPKEDAWKTASRYMVLRGTFNINSTSADAWKAFLAGMQDDHFSYTNNNGRVKVADVPPDRVLFSRFSLPASDGEGANAGDPNSWLGVRMLTEKQIDRLARECVRQVKERGPFLNMSDFVNRRLADDETGVCGALQAAIDWDEFLGRSPGGNSEESINGRYKEGDDYITAYKTSSWGLEFPLAARGSRYTGIPGYLTQADVLKRIGNNITVRDDTFTIRAYGEARGKNDEVNARAWCEAVVQRVPPYLDTSDKPETTHAELTSSINKKFGRKVRIVSFRWLSADEI